MAKDTKPKADATDMAIDAFAGALASTVAREPQPEQADAASDAPEAQAPAPAAKAVPAPAGANGGLASVPQIVELADQLSACADQLHERIMRDIRAYDGGIVPAHVQATARALLEDELVLRQRANGLYADAATYVVKSLGKSQQVVVALTTAAAEKIRKIALIGDITGLVGGLLQLAGAAATGQAASVITALDKINTHMKAIDANKAPAKPA
ncbi:MULTISPECIES: hypothetical protein [unclassified Massilia]|uniref:hypothetical protein n=1 Tax=unclassified Massilia TaxID=2609279 RepID=UPI001E45A3A4|nr:MULTISPECIES: hypothetical protein [unclassified Massilia]